MTALSTTTDPIMATPETLDQLADAHASAGDELAGNAFRAMAASWRATLRQLHETQAENSAMMLAMNRAFANAQRLEDFATATLNVLASARPPLRQNDDAHATQRVPS